MGRLNDEQTQALLTGVELEDGPAKCEKVEDGGGDEDSANHWYNVSLKEGRNREVRRLFEALGLAVSRLIRVRYGPIAMPSMLKRGDVIEMEPNDVNGLLKSIGLKANAGGAQGAETEPSERPRQHGPQQGAPQGKGPRPGQRGRRRGPPGAAVQGNVQRNGPGNADRDGRGSALRKAISSVLPMATRIAARTATRNDPGTARGRAPDRAMRSGAGRVRDKAIRKASVPAVSSVARLVMRRARHRGMSSAGHRADRASRSDAAREAEAVQNRRRTCRRTSALRAIGASATSPRARRDASRLCRS
jgi:hypothetical protein